RLVESITNVRMVADAIEHIAEKKEFSLFSVIEWFHAEMVARAKQSFLRHVPDGERKIAAQVLDAIRAPGSVRLQNQFRIRRRVLRFAVLALEFRDELCAGIQPGISRDPQPPIQ